MNSDIFRAFRSRNYRYFFAGQSLSLLGTWMQKTAVSWVVYAQTQSKFMLGVSVFATLFPSAVFSLLGGVVSDRYNRYRVLLLTQVLSMAQALLLTLAVYFKQDAVWEIIALSGVLGIINAFDVPARQALVYDLVDNKQDLPNAVAMNSTMLNLTKLLGPAVAGFAIEQLGAVACFGLNALSFVAVIGSLLALRLPAYVARARTKNLMGELAEGFQYVKDTPTIRFLITMLGITGLLVLPFTNLMPVYAKDIFRGTATTFGLLDGAIGLGGLIAALYLAALKPSQDLNKVLMTNMFVFGVGLVLFSYTPWFWLALPFLVVGAFGMMSQTTISITLLQTLMLPAMRGRVISIYVLVYTASVPLGSLLVGAVSERIGVQPTVLAEGLLALLIALLYVRNLRQVKAAGLAVSAATTPTAEVATAV
ncbi:MFS transporter [Microvirga sp. STS02]|uniref:MFS transporter n=1 Tax=Hymenobacter negativus TaxID=2795026 RepID=UPI0018DBD073|nr:MULTISPECIES: MFS transporter [Bacteria]MBH8567716.1 MFS transporter [Hymenobacter negativus]MBR7207450.1 MFS transporter [Microvirga sp. STS02]